MLEYHFPQYEPSPWLRNGHLMTLVPGMLRRTFPAAVAGAAVSREFHVEAGNRVMARCSWQADKAGSPTLIVVHGLEGSSEAGYVLGIAHKAYAMGMNVLRLNLRNCGGTMHLSSTLYHGGMSGDVIAVIRELQQVDKLQSFALMGFSLGGNIVVKAAAELSRARDSSVAAAQSSSAMDTSAAAHADAARDAAAAARDAFPAVHAVAAVSPSLDLHACVRAIQKRENRVYEQFFVRSLKNKIRDKADMHPDQYDVGKLSAVKGLMEFDDTYTSVHGGFGSAEKYYASQSALQFVDQIKIPTLVIAAQDDPLVPFSIFTGPAFANPKVVLLSPEHGGHAGFLARNREDDALLDRHWAENRAVQFCAQTCLAARRHAVPHQAE